MVNKVYTLAAVLLSDIERLEITISPPPPPPKPKVFYVVPMKNGKVIGEPKLYVPKPPTPEHGIVYRSFMRLFNIAKNIWQKITSYLRPSTVQIKPEINASSLKNAKKKVIDFIKGKQLTIAAYQNLITTLKKDAENAFSKILTKHQTLLDIQKKYPPRIKPATTKKSKWDLVKNAVKFGLITPNLEKVTARMKAANVHFMPLPIVPKKVKVFKLFGIANKINLAPPQYRTAVEWLINHMRVITFKELIGSLKEAAVEFNKLPDFSKGYSLIGQANKSQSWVPHLALRFMKPSHLPTKHIDFYGITSSWFAKGENRNFVHFDDVTYSGDQLINNLIAFHHHAARSKFFGPIHLCLIVGFMSEKAKERIKKQIALMKKDNIKVTLICKHTFKDIAQTMSEEDLPLQAEILTQAQNYNVSLGSLAFHKQDFKKTMITTEWKTPDGVSIPDFYITAGLYKKKPEIDTGYWDPNDDASVIRHVPKPY